MGAEATIDYEHEDLKVRAREISGGGVDVVIDPVGGRHSEPALRATRHLGRFCVIGFASGPIASIPLNQVLLNNRTVVGVDWGGWTFKDPIGNRTAHRRAHGPGRAGGGCTRRADRLPARGCGRGDVRADRSFDRGQGGVGPLRTAVLVARLSAIGPRSRVLRAAEDGRGRSPRCRAQPPATCGGTGSPAFW